MTNQQHPITPPSELIEDWIEIAKPEPWKRPPDPNVLCTLAAQWGSDQELDACCEWLSNEVLCESNVHRFLRAARRSKPQSLKEQALAELEKVDMLWDTDEFGEETLGALDTIRRALEQLPDNK
jgi:hypothetical protein